MADHDTGWRSAARTPVHRIRPIVESMDVGVLHPGAMGSALAGAISRPVAWASEGRSEDTTRRAQLCGLVDVGSLDSLVDSTDIVISVCPPHAAVDVAVAVSARGFTGIYVDANAVSPDTVGLIAERFDRFVDGGIIGPPPEQAGSTRLYLAGPDAPSVAELWAGSVVDAVVLDGTIGSASALKMAFAGWTKGSAALLMAVRAYAEAAGVSRALVAEWADSIPGLEDKVTRSAERTGPKAWRFAGEMEEIAQSMEAVGLPSGFHTAAARIYASLADLKGEIEPSLDEVLELLTRDASGASTIDATRASPRDAGRGGLRG